MLHCGLVGHYFKGAYYPKVWRGSAGTRVMTPPQLVLCIEARECVREIGWITLPAAEPPTHPPPVAVPRSPIWRNNFTQKPRLAPLPPLNPITQEPHLAAAPFGSTPRQVASPSPCW